LINRAASTLQIFCGNFPGKHMIDVGIASTRYRAVTMTPASRERVVNLRSEDAEEVATAMDEAKSVCDARPNLPIKTLYHAVYIPQEDRDPSDGNLLERRFADYN